LASFSALAAGPHPRRELTLMPHFGFAHPQRAMAAGATFSALAAGPHPRRELTLMPRFGFARPQRGMAAGASALALVTEISENTAP
jgi:hypothetical protein